MRKKSRAQRQRQDSVDSEVLIKPCLKLESLAFQFISQCIPFLV